MSLEPNALQVTRLPDSASESRLLPVQPADEYFEVDDPQQVRRRRGAKKDAKVHVTVINQPAPAASAPTPPAAQQDPRVLPFEQGNIFSHCLECKKPILWKENHRTAEEGAYLCANNACKGAGDGSETCKAVHVSCAVKFCLKQLSLPDHKDARGITVNCQHCKGSFDIDTFSSVKVLITSFLKSRQLKWFIALFILFVISGFAWKLWAFHAIVSGSEPVDIINNPALRAYDTSQNASIVLRPTWSWREFRAYNHCVLTDWGKRALRHNPQGRINALRNNRAQMAPVFESISYAEMLGQLYHMVTDSSSPSEIDLSGYFFPCSDTGSVSFSFWGFVSHLALCVHALRWVMVGTALTYFILFLDWLIGWRAWKYVVRKSYRFTLTQQGRTHAIAPAAKVASVRRRVIIQ